jgi:O-antigen/teichoic acid export membrane protein
MLPFSGSALRRNVTYTFGRQIIAALAQFLTVVIIARQLGAEGNGQYAMAILLPNLLVNFLNFGIGPANVYFLGRQEVAARQATIENVKIAGIIACAGTIGAFVLVRTWGEALFPGIPSILLYIGLVAFPIALLVQYLRTILQGVEDFKAFNWATLAQPLSTLLYILVAVYMLGLGLNGAVAGFALGQFTGLLIVWIYLRRHFKNEKSATGTYNNDYKRKSFTYGWKANISNILAFVNYRADIFLVNFLLNPASTGVYVIAVQIAEKLWLLSKAASTVLLPRLSAMHENPQARLRLTNKAFAGVGGLTLAAALLSAVALHFLLEPVFGAEFLDAFYPFIWLLPGIIAGAGARVQANCIAAAGKPEWNMYVAFGVVSLNILGNMLLIPIWSIDGAAIATSIAYIANAVVKLLLIRKTLKIEK